jgi:lipoate-protein ligase A
MKWQFLNTGFHSGIFNMDFDEALALRLKRGTCPPVLRVYGWEPHTISIGFNQNIEDFDIAALQRRGIGIVRRPTGGRAILHAHELTYSVVINSAQQSPKEFYRRINEGLLQSLRRLDISADLTENDDNFRNLYREPSSLPCFASSAKNEIQFEGKKLVGSAQRRYGNVILQHGSILLGPQHRQIVDFIASYVENSRNVIEETLLHHTSDAESILGRYVSFEETADCIKKGFEEALDITFAVERPLIDNSVQFSHITSS